MISRHSYSHIILLAASLFGGDHVDSAPIPMLTHIDGETSIWVTSHNTLNSSAPLQERSLLSRRQGPWGFSGPAGHFNGPPGDHWQGQWGPPGQHGPPSWSNPSWGPPGGPVSENTVPQAPPTSAPPPPETTVSTPPIPTTSVAPPTSIASTPVTSAAPSTTPSAPPPPPASSSPTSVPSSAAPSTVPASQAPPAPSTSAESAPPPPAPTTSAESVPPPPPAPTSSTAVAPPPPASSPPNTTPSSSPPAVPSSTTAPAPSSSPTGGAPSTGNTLQVSLVNNLGSSNVHAYVTGLDDNGQVVMLTNSGSYYNPPSPGTTRPQRVNADVAIPLNGPGQTTTITLPDYISSARVWFADGHLDFYVVDTQYGPGLVEPSSMNPNDPSADVNWGFVELTFKGGYGLFANLSFVDFVGLPLGIALDTASSGSQQALGVPSDAVSKVCDLLKGQKDQDGQPWDELCVNDNNGKLLRVVSPPTIISQDANAFSGYFDDYVNQVYQQYTSEQLMINTQGDAGQVACTSDGNTITCAGDSTSYTKPSSEDIFGCNSGTFAISQSDNDVHLAVVPRICAAINRATLHLSGGNVQPSLPPSSYYTAHPNNWYSAFVHQTQLDGKGYAFSYDDVAPSQAESVDGSVYASDPTVLTVLIGGSS